MKTASRNFIAALLIIVAASSCTSVYMASPAFTVSLRAVNIKHYLPGLQSFAWATEGNKLLLIGGRTEGFHGLPSDDTSFNVKKANDSIFVINLVDYSYRALALSKKDTSFFQFSSSNMEFKQAGDTLYLVGGFGTRDTANKQSNYTFNTITSVKISEMIHQVEMQNGGDPDRAILNRASSPFLAVTGGELIKINNLFYLMFGQHYSGIYDIDNSGKYTSAVRQFRFNNNNTISDTLSFIDTNLHRRDLNVAPLIQNEGLSYAGYGGVFTKDISSYNHPVYLSFAGGKVIVKPDTLTQITNQYECAKAFIYDPSSKSDITILFGGIGKFQYNEKTKKWENGDHGAPLPFVKSITQLVYQNGYSQQKIQLPPSGLEMPALIGSDAIFIPDSSLIYSEHIIDFSKLKPGSSPIGIIFGGIKSTFPTSSGPYPTFLNKIVYWVYLNYK